MMPEEIKRIDVAEFRKRGYLQEMNRQFLHPLGMAIEVIVDDDGNERFGGVWDYRDDEEGMSYGDLGVDDAIKGRMVEVEMKEKAATRLKLLGYVIQPLPEDER